MNLLSLCLTLAAAAFCYITIFHFCHIFQLEGYKPREYVKWLGEFGGTRIAYTLGMAVLYVAMSTVLVIAHSLWAYIAGGILALIFLGGCIFFPLQFGVKNAKLPLKYTWRVIRMLITEAVLLVGFAIICAYCSAPIMGIAVAGSCVLILAANAINAPLELLVKKHFFNDAKRKLEARPDIIKIGITGSYGKTSTKFILGTILGEKYRVLVPRAVLIRPLGLTRVIREQLKEEHRCFIAEMGAKQVGDIAELVELVHPAYGIITSVGPQHLESFKSIEMLPKQSTNWLKAFRQMDAHFSPMTSVYKKIV